MLQKIKENLPLLVFLSYFYKMLAMGTEKNDAFILGICAIMVISQEVITKNMKKDAKREEEINNSLKSLHETCKSLEERCEAQRQDLEKTRTEIGGLKISRVIK